MLPPQAFIGPAKAHLLRLVSPALRNIPRAFVTSGWVPGADPFCDLHQHRLMANISELDGVAPALMTFTSGSTGRPKATVRSHRFLLAQHLVLEKHLALRAGEVDLTALPIFVLANLGSGVTSLVPAADLRRPALIKPEPVLGQVVKFQATRSAGSPAFFERLLESLEKFPGDNLELPRMRIYTGGGPVFPSLLSRLHSKFQQNPIAVYGSTEAEPIAHLSAADITADDHLMMQNGGGLLAGHPVPEISLRVLKDQWGTPLGELSLPDLDRLTLAAGEAGEIVVSGDHVLTGYLHGVGNQETKFSVKGVVWHRTGDLGSLDAQGRLWLLGRCLAKIVDSHGELYPFAVECVARNQNWVCQAACVSQEGDRCLVLQVRVEPSNAEWDDLQQQLQWAHLQRYEVVEALPMDKRHNAKIDYPKLRRLLLNRQSKSKR
jgi:acyl-CoA synthetase (AMP-forming)/AMP-acid ligase II